jgi:hypothetical protein
VFDVHVTLLDWNVVHPGDGGVALNDVQDLKISNSLFDEGL